MPMRTTFVLTLPAPHALVDTSQYSPFQADALHGAPATHSFCLFELPERRAAGADREEQLRILVAAGRVLIPAHRSPPTVLSHRHQGASSVVDDLERRLPTDGDLPPRHLEHHRASFRCHAAIRPRHTPRGAGCRSMLRGRRDRTGARLTR